MIGDNAKQVLMEDMVKRTLNPRILISKTEKVPQYGDNPLYNKDFFFTSGLYYLKFAPSNGPNVKKQSKFLISCDLFPGKRHRIVSYRMIEDFAKEGDWRFQFLLKWTTLKKEHFDIAVRNINLAIPFVFKIDEYYKMLTEKNTVTEVDPETGTVTVTANDWELLREDGMNEAESTRLKHIKDVIWELPVKIEV
jgi:hypothetical protein